VRVLDLFSGIGGFSLGLERAGMETVAFCEIEEYPRKVLKKHWPDVPIYEDIRELTGDRLKQDGITADLICGGYPCQPFSTAGKRQGEGDDRHLWPEMYRLIKTLRPRWVIAENVAGHVSMGLDAVLSDLEAEDYTWWPFIIPACAVDAKHRRDRIWIIANASSRRGRPDARAQSRTEKESAELLSQDGEPLPSDIEAICGDVANTTGIYAQGQFGRQREEQFGGGCRWEPEPDVDRVAARLSDGVDRLKGLGNAVVPQVVENIGRAIMEIESNAINHQ